MHSKSLLLFTPPLILVIFALSQLCTGTSAEPRLVLSNPWVHLLTQPLNHNTSEPGYKIGMSKTFCGESNIKFKKYAVRYNWKIQGLRQYIAYSDRVNNGELELTRKVRLTNLPPEGGYWEFRLLGKSGSPMELRASYTLLRGRTTNSNQETSNETFTNYESDDDYASSMKDAIFTINLMVQEGKVFRSFAPLISTPILTRDIFYLSFVWEDFDSDVLDKMRDQTDIIDVQFYIRSIMFNDIESFESGCSHKQESGEDETDPSDIQLEPEDTSTIQADCSPPFASHMGAIMRDDKYTDLIIKTGDEEFKVHRIIFANSSPVFATMISNSTLDKSESLLDLGAEIGADVVEELIRYIYTGKLEDIEEIAERVIVPAHKYQFPELKRICEAALIKQVRTDNAFSMYSLAVEVDAQNLRKRVFELMKENKAKVVNQTEDFRKLSVHHPEIMYELFLS